jgi:Na+/melibiose symporter-like transporter
MSSSVTPRTLFGYGVLGLPLAMLGLPLYIYLPTFYANELGLGVTAVGIILFFSRLFDTLLDPIIGYVNDRMPMPGRRKRFILFGGLLLAVAFYLLLNPPSSGGHAIWLFLFSLISYAAWSLVQVPYLAWGAEISDHYHDKTRLSAAREGMAIVGMITALLVPYLFGTASSGSDALGLLFIAFVALMIPALLLNLNLVGNAPQTRLQHTPFLTTLKALFTALPQVRRLVAAYFLNNLANAIPATMFLIYVEFVLGAKDQTGLLLLLYFAAGIAGLPLWSALSKRIGKRRAWIASMIVAASVFAFVPFLGQGDVTAFIIISLLSGLSLGADMALPASIQSDLVQNASKQRLEIGGFLFGIWAMVTKLALAAAVGLSFVLLGLSGFDAADPSSGSPLAIALIYSLLPVTFKLIAGRVMHAYRE